MKDDKNDIIFNKKFKFTHNIDDELLKPGKKILFGGKERTLAEMNELFPPTENKISMFIEWDNMCQRNAIGLNSVLSDILKDNRKLDLKSFFERNNYPNSFDYIKKVLYNDCDEELIDKLIIKKYSEITSKSPVTEFFNKLFLMKFMISDIVFMFRYNNESLSDFVKEIEDKFFKNGVKCDYRVLKNEDEEIENIKKDKFYDPYVVPDAGLYYKTFIDLDKRNTTIMTYRAHNGINPYLLSLYINEFLMQDLPGPNGISIDFMEEYKNNDKKENINES